MLTAINIRTTVFLDVTPYNLVHYYQRFYKSAASTFKIEYVILLFTDSEIVDGVLLDVLQGSSKYRTD